MLRVINVLKFLRRQRTGSWWHIEIYRYIDFFTVILMLAHWLACVWFSVSVLSAFILRNDMGSYSVSHLYLVSFYWAYFMLNKAANDRGIDSYADAEAIEFFISIGGFFL